MDLFFITICIYKEANKLYYYNKMSIKVGFTNQNYTLNNIQNESTLLRLNSYNDSNIIILNSDNNTTSDVLITYKDKYQTGLKNNSFIIYDMYNNQNQITITSNNILFNNNLLIKNIVDINDSNVIINNSVIFNLTSNNFFKINYDKKQIFDFENSNLSICTNNLNIHNFNYDNLLLIDSSNVNFYNDLKIYNGKLYVKEIIGINGYLQLTNVKYNIAVTDSLTTTTSIGVKNNNLSSNSVLIDLYKNPNNTCNIIEAYTDYKTALYTVSNKGFIGIGTDNPIAALNIHKISSNTVIRYLGDAIGDTFILTNRANIGIGTSIPYGQLHIKRNDDLINENIRKTPMLNIEMNYDETLNNCNVISPIQTDAITINSIKMYSISENYNNQKITKFYLGTSAIQSYLTQNNIDNIIMPDMGIYQMNDIPILLSDNTNVNLVNTIIYPTNNNNYVLNFSNMIPDPQTIVNGINIYNYNILFQMMTKQTFNNGSYTDINKFTFYMFNNILINLTNNDRASLTFKFYIEMNINSIQFSYPYNYQIKSQYIVSPPDFINFIKNNNYVGSISSYGTLSLGSRSPSSNYLLYIPTNALINNLTVNSINTNQTNNTINFMNTNISNIQNLYCGSLSFNSYNVQNLITLNATITNINATNITLNQNTATFTPNNINYTTNFTLGNTATAKNTNNQTFCKITVNNTITPKVSINNFYSRNNGILITNEIANFNPCLEIQGANNAIPYININNSTNEYLFRLTKQSVGNNATTTNFQLATNMLTPSERSTYFTNNLYNPYIMQHIADYNTLSFGENDIICIDCKTIIDNTQKTNSSSKITIGIPYNVIKTNYIDRDYVKFFNDNIRIPSNNFMLNIFGNTKIADIDNNPMITAISSNSKIYTAINGNPDNINTLKVNGTIASDNIISDNIITSNLITSNLTVYNEIYMDLGGDLGIKGIKNLLQYLASIYPSNV